MKPLIASVLILVLTVGCGSVTKPKLGPTPAGDTLKAETSAVGFSYRDLQGKRLSARSFRGQVLVVSYFATWCAECLEQLPRFNSLLREFADGGGLDIIAVSVDLRPRQDLPPVLELVRPIFKVALADESDLFGQTSMGPLTGIPMTFLINKEGYVTETLQGEVPMPYLRRRVLELMGET